MKIRLCVVCGTALPSDRRSDQRYCKVDCRVRAHKIRREHGTRQRRPRREGERAAKGLVELVIGAAAIEALRRELAQAHEQAKKERTALARERQSVAALRAEGEQLRAERAAEPERLRKALEEEREGLRSELASISDERLRSALDQQRQQLCTEFEAKKERLLLEAATAGEERLRSAIREERRLANEREGALYVLVNRLRFERAGAEDQKRTAERANTQLLADREGLRKQLWQSTERCKFLEERDERISQEREYLEQRCDQLVESQAAARHKLVAVTEQCKRLSEHESGVLKELAETKAHSQLRNKQLLDAREQFGLLCNQYKNLQIEHNNLAGRLVGEYRGLLAANEQQWIEWANQQCAGWAAENARLRSECCTLQDHNSRLNYALQGQSEPATDAVARLEATVKRQRRQLKQLEEQFEAHLALPAASTTSRRQPNREELPPASTEPGRKKRSKRLPARRREEGVLSGAIRTVGLAAGGVATGLLIGEVYSGHRQNALPASSQAPRPALPPKR